MSEKSDGDTTFEITITADRTVLSTAHTLAAFIAKMDISDPHYELKLANLIKGYTHGVKADENRAAIWRTECSCQTPEDFKNFFQRRVDVHNHAHENWFKPEMDCWKLKHFYEKTDTKYAATCATAHLGECRCWEIKP